MSDLNEIVPVENADARRDLLSAQFDEAEAAAPEPERAQPAQAEKPRDEVGKFAKAAPAEERPRKIRSGAARPQAGKKTITRLGIWQTTS